MPWIAKNGPGWRVRDRKDGKIVSLSQTFPTQAEAQRWIASHVTGDQHLTTLLERWSASIRHSPHARESSARLATVFLRQRWTHISHLTPTALDAWQSSDRFCRRDLQVLLTVLRWAHRVHGLPIPEAVLEWRLPRQAPRPPPPLLTDAQVLSIRLAAAHYGPRATALIDYLLTYGARPITACRLKITDLRHDDDGWTLTIDQAKHSGGWSHPIRMEDAVSWKQIDHPGDALFPHYKEDRPWKINARGMAQEVTDWYKGTIAKRVKLPAGLNTIYHLKRHSITSMLTNLDPATVALFSGHRCQDQVLRYSRTNREKATAALAALGSNRSLTPG